MVSVAGAAQKLPEVLPPWGLVCHQTWQPACSSVVLPPQRKPSWSKVSSPIPAARRVNDCLGCAGFACTMENTSCIPSSFSPDRVYPNLQHPTAVGDKGGLAWLSCGVPLFNQEQCLIIPEEHVGAPLFQPCHGRSALPASNCWLQSPRQVVAAPT